MADAQTPIELPEDLADLEPDQLNALADEIRAAGVALAEDAAASDEALAEVERLGDAYAKVRAELASREAADAERAERAAAALEAFGPDEPEAGDDAVDETVTEEASVEAAVVEPTETAVADPEPQPAEPVAATVELAADPTPQINVAVNLTLSKDGETLTVDTADEPVAAEETPVVAEVETPAVEAATEDVVEAAVTETVVAADTEDAPVEAADTVVEASADTVVEASTATEDTEATVAADDTQSESEAVEANVDTPAAPDAAVAALTEARPAEFAPTEATTSGDRRLGRFPTRATLAAAGIAAEGADLSVSELAEAITRKRHSLGNVPYGMSERIVVGTSTLEFEDDRRVGTGAEENYKVFSALTRQQTEAIVASGGNCAPLNPSYEFFRLAEPMSPVEDALPVAAAPRGGIRFIVPPDFRDASAGVRVTTEAEDAAGYTTLDPAGTTAPKPCVRVECPDIEECRVDAVSQCVTFGNLNYRVFPEQVEAFLADIAVIFAETKEVFYLDGIDAGSTAVNSTPPYGATRGLVFDWARASVAYRKRNHMPIDAPLDILVPDWVIPFVKADMVNDHSLGLGFLGASLADVQRELFSSLNLNVTFYYDSETGAAQAYDQAQVAGALNPWPASVVSYMFSPGTFVRLDAGTLDLGLVRDSVLNGTNDLQLFMEQWIQVCKVGIESIRLESTVCPSGGAPEPLAILECAS